MEAQRRGGHASSRGWAGTETTWEWEGGADGGELGGRWENAHLEGSGGSLVTGKKQQEA